MDSTAIEVSPERDSFLNLFYDEQMDTLLSPFLQPDMWTEDGLLTKDVDKDKEDEVSAKKALVDAMADNGAGGGVHSQAHRDALHGMAAVAARRRERKACWDCARKHVVDLLSFSVEHHGHRIKYYMLRNNVMQAVTNLLQQADKHLVLTALKFLRQVFVLDHNIRAQRTRSLTKLDYRMRMHALPCEAHKMERKMIRDERMHDSRIFIL